MPPPVSFVAIGLLVATIGFSIGLDADIFRDVAAEASGAARALSRPTHSPSMALRAVLCGKWPALPFGVRRYVYAGSRLFPPSLNWATRSGWMPTSSAMLRVPRFQGRLALAGAPLAKLGRPELGRHTAWQALGRSGRCPSKASHVRRHDDPRANSATIECRPIGIIARPAGASCPRLNHQQTVSANPPFRKQEQIRAPI